MIKTNKTMEGRRFFDYIVIGCGGIGSAAVYWLSKRAHSGKVLYIKTCLKRPLKNRQNKGLNDKCQLNESREYCRMLQHSAILLTCMRR